VSKNFGQAVVKFGGPLTLVLLMLACGCSRKAAPPEETQTPPSVDRPLHQSSEEPKNLVHGVFSVNKYTQFAFVVPAHQAYPRVHGDFRSFTKRRDPDSSNDQTADVSLMLLNEQEFNDFLQGKPGSTTYQSNPAHDQTVDWRVPITYEQPEQYHLVFSNPDGGPKTKFVKADFTVSFE
jgi:hypothetical protein